jgi:hypothetical protein
LIVSPQTPTDPAQPFSVPFQITNASYFPLRDVKIFCYAHRVKVGGMTITSCLSTNQNWNARHLGRGESTTIITNFVHAPILPAEADIVIAAKYLVPAIPFARLWYFARFEGNFGTIWQWLRQPSKQVQAAAKRMINRAR